MADFDDIYDALKATVAALGGTKQVAARMRPTIDPLKARSWLLNCLNPEHSMKFDPEEVQWIWRAGCDAGFHDGKHWADRNSNYSPSQPIALQAQLAEALLANQALRRRAEESDRDLRSLIDNPKLMALANALHLKVEAA